MQAELRQQCHEDKTEAARREGDADIEQAQGHGPQDGFHDKTSDSEDDDAMAPESADLAQDPTIRKSALRAAFKSEFF
jgi:hypothetical protein